MFYVTFFMDFLSRPFLGEKLGKFLCGDSSQAWLHSGGADWPIGSADDLPHPELNYAYRSFWFLHGEKTGGGATVAPPTHHLYDVTSHARLNGLLRELAGSYRWALVPWGGTEEFMGLAFVTSDQSLKERFVNCSENSVEPYRVYENILGADVAVKKFGTLISSYEVADGLEDVCRACLFLEEYEETGRGVWEVCGLAAESPYVVSGAPDGVPLSNSLTDEQCQPFAANFESLGRLTSCQGVDLYLYRPCDEKTLMAMCRLGGDRALLVMPGTTEVGEVRRVVEKTEREYDFSDLVHIGDILASCKWLYAIGRGHADEHYSFFVARESGLVKAVSLAGVDADQPFLLVSCF